MSFDVTTLALAKSYADQHGGGDGYIKPDSGIPKSDLSNEVQTSLSKADTALQEHQDISGKQDVITETNKLPYSLLSDTPTIPASASDIGIIEYTATEIDELWDSI